jgi:hypothetical protein
METTTVSPPETTVGAEARLASLRAPELRAALARGIDAAIACLPIEPRAREDSALSRLATSTIGEIDHDTLTAVLSADVIAGVVLRFDGPCRGTALLAVDPGDALLWLQMEESGDEPLARFVAQGRRMLEAVIARLAGERAGEACFGPPSLEERPLMAALLATHAPSDTVILSLDAQLAFELDPTIGTLNTPFTTQLLLEPKVFQQLGNPRS